MRSYYPFKIIGVSLRDFFHDNGPTYAASLAFFFIVAVVPLLLFTVTVFGHLLGESREFMTYFVDELMALFPSITIEMTNELKRLITFRGIGTFGIIIYAAVSFQLYRAMHLSTQAIFKVREKRPFYMNVLYSFLVVAIFVFLMFVSFSASTMVSVLQVIDNYIPVFKISTGASVMLRFVLPLFLVMFTSIFMYIVLPKRFVRFYHAFWGGLFTATMLEAAKHLFTWYVSSVRDIGAIYGSLSTFVVFLLWVYYSWSIFLIGGEIVHNLTDPTHARPHRRATDPDDMPEPRGTRPSNDVFRRIKVKLNKSSRGKTGKRKRKK